VVRTLRGLCSMRQNWFLPGWKLKTDGTILPEDRLPATQTILVGLQHVVAMFGATVLAPLLMGLDPNVAVLFSGVGTLIFFVAVGGRVPSYLGSSFSFIAVVVTATGYVGPGGNQQIDIALGGIMAAGALYTLIGVAVIFAGHGWVEKLMPPVVTGAVVAVIGLNLAPIAIKNVSRDGFATVIGLMTVLTVAMVTVFAPGIWRRIPILAGGAIAYGLYWVSANGIGWGDPIDFSTVSKASWFGLPKFSAPSFDARAMALITPVAMILVAENLGHLKSLSAMIGRNLDPYLGRAFIGDGIATMLAGSAGGPGGTTYAENIGVMAVTKIYSTLVFVVAALFAILLGFSPKFGALILTIPTPVIGGLSIVVFGLIAATAGRIWVENRVDFSKTANLVTVGASLVAGAGDLSLHFAGFTLGGIGTATFGAIVLYHLLSTRSDGDLSQESRDAWASSFELARAARISSMGEMAASIAHEISQPLTAIVASGNVGTRWLEKTPPNINQARAALKRIVNDGYRINEIIGTIRAMFKRESAERKPIELNELIRAVFPLVENELRNNQVILQSELMNNLSVVRADRVQLQQVILNLMTNAIDAMQGVTPRARILKVKSEPRDFEELAIIVEDSGVGIDPKNLDRIFDPFFTTKANGMGLGLAICRSIIEAHHGHMRVIPGAHYGTRFEIVLPASEPVEKQ
jgi:putative pyrimidine permease RutG